MPRMGLDMVAARGLGKNIMGGVCIPKPNSVSAAGSPMEAPPFDIVEFFVGVAEELQRLNDPLQPPLDLAPPGARFFPIRDRMIPHLRPGDHIAVRRRAHWHHGIYAPVCEEGLVFPHVIDFWGAAQSASIDRRPLHLFASDVEEVALVNHDGALALSLPESLQRAEELLARFQVEGRPVYHPALFTCEHFATLCRCDRSVAATHRLVRLALEAPHVHVPQIRPAGGNLS